MARPWLAIKIGVIGFTTPGIMNYKDKRHLEGKLSVTGAVEAAQKYVPELRSKAPTSWWRCCTAVWMRRIHRADMENPARHLSKVAGIDAMVMGHQHSVFPDTAEKPAFSMAGVDNKAGTINGVPAVMASSWGKALGVVALSLVWDGKAWTVDKAKSKSELPFSSTGKMRRAKPPMWRRTPALRRWSRASTQAAIRYVKTPIGQTDFRMGTQFADVGDPGAIQLVNQAQQDYVQRYIQANLPQYAQLPVLSVSAPFKSGFRGRRLHRCGCRPAGHQQCSRSVPVPEHGLRGEGERCAVKSWLEAAAQPSTALIRRPRPTSG